jgi:hypothetical protein
LRGDAQDAEQLLTLVYNELRKLAAQMLACESACRRVKACWNRASVEPLTKDWF